MRVYISRLTTLNWFYCKLKKLARVHGFNGNEKGLKKDESKHINACAPYNTMKDAEPMMSVTM